MALPAKTLLLLVMALAGKRTRPPHATGLDRPRAGEFTVEKGAGPLEVDDCRRQAEQGLAMLPLCRGAAGAGGGPGAVGLENLEAAARTVGGRRPCHDLGHETEVYPGRTRLSPTSMLFRVGEYLSLVIFAPLPKLVTV